MTTMMTERDAYAEVRTDFVRQHAAADDSPEFRWLRTSIIERCLPLADHIARRCGGRGIGHDDLVQVARVGLVNAVGRLARQDVVEALTAGTAFRARSIGASLSHDDGPALAVRLGQNDPGLRFIEDREALPIGLAPLSQRQRDIVSMQFFEGLTQSQIAERVGMSQLLASRLLAQSLSTLRDRMIATSTRTGEEGLSNRASSVLDGVAHRDG